MYNDVTKKSPNGYGKRPLWLWIVLYIVIGGLIYGLIYYFVIAKHGGYGSITVKSTKSSVGTTTPPQSQSSSIFEFKMSQSGTAYLASPQGMTLYVYDGDTAGSGMSTCTGECAANWPPYISGANTASSLPANITIITRADGSKQFAWKGKPLYYFAGDTQVGQISGDGVSGFHMAQ